MMAVGEMSPVAEIPSTTFHIGTLPSSPRLNSYSYENEPPQQGSGRMRKQVWISATIYEHESDRKSAKWHWWLDSLFALLWSAHVKAERKTLVKSTPGVLSDGRWWNVACRRNSSSSGILHYKIVIFSKNPETGFIFESHQVKTSKSSQCFYKLINSNKNYIGHGTREQLWSSS